MHGLQRAGPPSVLMGAACYPPVTYNVTLDAVSTQKSPKLYAGQDCVGVDTGRVTCRTPPN